MTERKIEELEFETTSRFVAYDSESGEILYVHECMRQKGSYESEPDPDENHVLQLARLEFDDRDLKVMKAPEGYDMKPDVKYSVDTYSGELKESKSETMTFREFIKLPE